MKKRIGKLALFLLTLFPYNVCAYDIEIDGIYYNANVEKMVLTVTSGETNYSGSIIIPSQVDYKGRSFLVKGIGDSAFRNSAIESVTIPSSVTSIGWNAFENCKQLSKATFNEGLGSISDDAFAGCTKLEELTIPSSVKYIRSGAFCNTGIKKLILLDGEEKLYLGAAGSGGGPGASPFGNSPTTYVYLGRTLDFIWSSPFPNMPIKEFIIGNQVKSLPEMCIKDLEIEELIIPSSVESLGRSCITCKNLKKLIIEESSTQLYVALYSHLSNIEYLYIGRNLKLEKYSNSFISESKKIETLILGENLSDYTDISFSSTIKDIFVKRTTPVTYTYSPFNSGTYLDATLYVPQGCVDVYKNAEGWKIFWNIKETSGGTDIQKCSKPIIQYSNGKLSYSSSTEGATFISSITNTDITSYSSNEILLGVTYNINVYATKPGFENSEVATATLCWIDVDPKTEGISNSVTQVRAHAVLIQAREGQITITGTDDGTKISVYEIDGHQVGSTISHNGYANLNTNIRPGSIAIIKIGDKNMKVVVK